MAEDNVKKCELGAPVGRRVQCLACERRCLILPGRTGFCSARKNVGGGLYTLVYGDISSMSANPIEKKPFFHFHPGTRALTIGGWSCNFTCPWCQNHEISQSPTSIGRGRYVSPEEFVGLVAQYNCQGTSVSLNEPILLLEYSLDIFRLARDLGYYNTYVTNGYMTLEALQLLVDCGLDAMNIDVKGEAEVVRTFCGADVDIVWRNAAWAKERGVWIELTTLVIPGVNDDGDGFAHIAQRIKRELGAETPWHLSSYHPTYRFQDEDYHPPTPVATLERARDVGVSEGLNYVYVGNVLGHSYESTYCPGCGKPLIQRDGFTIVKCDITQDKHCPDCGQGIPMIGEYPG